MSEQIHANDNEGYAEDEEFDRTVETQTIVMVDAFCSKMETVGIGFYTIAIVTALSRILEAQLKLLNADERYCAGAVAQKISDEIDGRKSEPH